MKHRSLIVFASMIAFSLAANGQITCSGTYTTGSALYIPAGVSCEISSNVTLDGTVIFQEGATLAPDDGVTVTLNGVISAPSNAQIFEGAGQVVVNAPWVSVAWWGALVPDSDAAPAFQAAMGSDRTVYVPAGSYTFESDQSVSLPVSDKTGVLVKNVSNLDIEGSDATISMADAVDLSSVFHFIQVTNLTVQGLTFEGNRNNLTSSQENAALSFTSVVNFFINNITLTGNWGGVGAAVTGDWLVNGTFDNFVMNAVGQCFDTAFLNNVTFENFQAVGADTNGNQGSGQVGQKCVSVIYDTPLASYNETGVSYPDTDGVVISGGSVTNFSTGANIATGENYSFYGNSWSNNPGKSPSSKGIGIYIQDGHGGSSSPIGYPPSNITVYNDQFTSNGAAVSGAGFQINNASITNSDVMSGITVINSTFNNNNNIGINANSTSSLTDVLICGNTFEGTNQTTAIGSNLSGIANTCQ